MSQGFWVIGIQGMKYLTVGGRHLSADPEVKKTKLSKDDEFIFMYLGTFTSQNICQA